MPAAGCANARCFLTRYPSPLQADGVFRSYFINSRTGRLGKAPAKALPFAKDWSREQRCIENAKVLALFTAA